MEGEMATEVDGKHPTGMHSHKDNYCREGIGIWSHFGDSML